MLRVANCSGFYGDRLSAALEMVEGGPIDVLTGDYLAELTLSILHKDRQKDPAAGYAKTFPIQLEQVAALCLEKGIKIVVNAGGLNPAGCAELCRGIYRKLGLKAQVAHLEGDDLLPRMGQLLADGETFEHLDRGLPLAELKAPILSANAYLGGWGISAALERGADLVICPRVTDASLVLGPAAWCFGWARDDWHRLASAVVAGHILECGTQATGGNYSFFQGFAEGGPLGFPLAEIFENGDFVVTKHPCTGGEVSVGTVTAQLLYEIDSPAYLNPDVTACFDSMELIDDGADRVRVRGVRGAPPPESTKVCINHFGGFKNRVTFLLTGLDQEQKAAWVERSLWRSLGGRESFAESRVVLSRSAEPEPGTCATVEGAISRLTISVKDGDPKQVGRRFSAAAVELALASYPGFNLAAPPAKEQPFAVYWPALVAKRLKQRVVIDGEAVEIPPTPGSVEPLVDRATGQVLNEVPVVNGVPGSPPDALDVPDGPTQSLPLGRICGARSGDKGGNANLGIWTDSEPSFQWLRAWLTVEQLRLLIPEAADVPIDRHELPNLRALNFVLRGFLGDGVAASLSLDAQAKGLGEHFRAQTAPIPSRLINKG